MGAQTRFGQKTNQVFIKIPNFKEGKKCKMLCVILGVRLIQRIKSVHRDLRYINFEHISLVLIFVLLFDNCKITLMTFTFDLYFSLFNNYVKKAKIMQFMTLRLV